MLGRILKLMLPDAVALCRVTLKINRCVALTFDDGPVPKRTEEVLRILEPTNHKATFFLIGDRVAKYPKLARQILKAGHEIGNHSFEHEPWLRAHRANSQTVLRVR